MNTASFVARHRRSFLISLLGAAGGAAAVCSMPGIAQQPKPSPPDPGEARKGRDRARQLVGAGEKLTITQLETILVKPRWLFLKVHTDAGIVGLGEPIVEGRAETCATAVKELAEYLVGKDPRSVVHHWQAMYRHAFYRGGPVLTSALSGVDIALWDIKGKALGIPVYEFFGGPTRERVRVYSHARTPEQIHADYAKGFRTFKTGVAKERPFRMVETPAAIDRAAAAFAALREAAGDDSDIGIDFHGAIPPQSAKVLIQALEPYQPMFIEEPCQAQNHEVMADIARSTYLPIATGERVFTKWGFREALEAGAASILQPDLCHAGGISECRLIAGMAEAYYAAIAPHNPLGPISLAAGVQLAASIPNFLCQEQVSLGEGYLKQPFVLREGYLDLPRRPGLGVELDKEFVQSKLDHDYRPAETYDADDGSVVDR